MKTQQVNLVRRDGYGLVLEESDRWLPRRSEAPEGDDGPAATPPEPRRRGRGLQPLDLAIFSLAVAGVVGFWFLVGKLVLRACALLLAQAS